MAKNELVKALEDGLKTIKKKGVKALKRTKVTITHPPHPADKRTKSGKLLSDSQDKEYSQWYYTGQLDAFITSAEPTYDDDGLSYGEFAENNRRRMALEAKGWTFGSAEEFLKLSKKEEALMKERANWNTQLNDNYMESCRLNLMAGIALEKAMEKAGLTRKTLAKKLRHSLGYVNGILDGDDKITLEVMAEFGLACGVRWRFVGVADYDSEKVVIERT